MKVEWPDCARDDLDDLVRNIGRDSGFYARRFAERVVLPHDGYKLLQRAVA